MFKQLILRFWVCSYTKTADFEQFWRFLAVFGSKTADFERFWAVWVGSCTPFLVQNSWFWTFWTSINSAILAPRPQGTYPSSIVFLKHLEAFLEVASHRKVCAEARERTQYGLSSVENCREHIQFWVWKSPFRVWCFIVQKLYMSRNNQNTLLRQFPELILYDSSSRDHLGDPSPIFLRFFRDFFAIFSRFFCDFFEWDTTAFPIFLRFFRKTESSVSDFFAIFLRFFQKTEQPSSDFFAIFLRFFHEFQN